VEEEDLKKERRELKPQYHNRGTDRLEEYTLKRYIRNDRKPQTSVKNTIRGSIKDRKKKNA